mgnify:CR=1 FL=1
MAEKESNNKMAAALKYDTDKDQAPRLIAYGQGGLAEEIIDIAQENDIHLHQDPALTELLSSVEIGSEIPEEAYQVVAEILAFVYRLSRERF